jgi:hypothetical protein
MENRANKQSLLMAYRVPGFRARARIDSYEVKHPAFVITLDRRQKKRCAVDAARRITASMTENGIAPATSIAAIAKSIWTSRCGAWPAKGAAA